MLFRIISWYRHTVDPEAVKFFQEYGKFFSGDFGYSLIDFHQVSLLKKPFDTAFQYLKAAYDSPGVVTDRASFERHKDMFTWYTKHVFLPKRVAPYLSPSPSDSSQQNRPTSMVKETTQAETEKHAEVQRLPTETLNLQKLVREIEGVPLFRLDLRYNQWFPARLSYVMKLIAGIENLDVSQPNIAQLGFSIEGTTDFGEGGEVLAMFLEDFVASKKAGTDFEKTPQIQALIQTLKNADAALAGFLVDGKSSGRADQAVQSQAEVAVASILEAGLHSPSVFALGYPPQPETQSAGHVVYLAIESTQNNALNLVFVDPNHQGVLEFKMSLEVFYERANTFFEIFYRGLLEGSTQKFSEIIAAALGCFAGVCQRVQTIPFERMQGGHCGLYGPLQVVRYFLDAKDKRLYPEFLATMKVLLHQEYLKILKETQEAVPQLFQNAYLRGQECHLVNLPDERFFECEAGAFAFSDQPVR